jgi:hypothetical protein
VLSYWGAFGALALRTADLELAGLGVVEHAWGADTRLDVARFTRRWWHWDVLAFEDGTVAAGLAIDAGAKLRGVRCGGRVPGGDFAAGVRFTAGVDAWARDRGRRVPSRWHGGMRLGDAKLRYEATASTPVADEVPEGGFLGFTFRAEWTLDGGRRVDARGTGFTEYRAPG